MALRDAEIRAIRAGDASVKKADGKGLYVEAFPNGSKLWRLKYRIAGKEKQLAPFPCVRGTPKAGQGHRKRPSIILP